MNVLWKCQLALIVDALLAVGGPATPALRPLDRGGEALPRQRAGDAHGRMADWRRRARQPERNGRRLEAAHLLRVARGGGHLERQHHQPPGLG